MFPGGDERVGIDPHTDQDSEIMRRSPAVLISVATSILSSLFLSSVFLSCAVPEPENPEFSPAAEVDLEPEALVIGVQLGQEVKAYPISAMAPLEILNDEIGGEPIAITWCPLSASSAVFSRRVGDTVHRFNFHPDLYLMNLLVFDDATESQWSQLALGALRGELEGTPWPLLPSLHTTWGHWRALHPETLVMDPIWGTHEFQYREAGDPGPDGMGERSLVHVVPWNGEMRAYPLDAVAQAGGTWVDALEEETDEAPIHVRYLPEGPTSWAQDPEGNLLPGITMYRKHVGDFYPEAVWPMHQAGLHGASGVPTSGSPPEGTPVERLPRRRVPGGGR